MGCDDLLRPSSTNVCFLVSICLHLDLNSSPGCTRFQTGSVLHGCRAVETPAREVNLPIPLQGNWGPVDGTAGRARARKWGKRLTMLLVAPVGLPERAG